MTLPLAGIKIVDFSEHGFVPSGAAALGDWGADVVKIERLEGDPMRSVIRNGLSPDADGIDYLFEMANRNKRGIALDVTTPAGRAVFERLVQVGRRVHHQSAAPGAAQAPHRARRPLRAEPEARVRQGPRPGPARRRRRSRRLRLGVVLVARRHGPHPHNEIHEIAEVPRTLSGKALEVPVKRILMGQSPDKAASRESLANPGALDYFVELADGG